MLYMYFEECYEYVQWTPRVSYVMCPRNKLGSYAGFAMSQSEGVLSPGRGSAELAL